MGRSRADDAVSALSDLFELVRPDGEQRELHCALPVARVDEAAVLTARAIVERRLYSNTLRDVWATQHDSYDVEVADETERTLLHAHLCQNLGTPDEPSVDVHVGGLVAETLWAEFVASHDEGLGIPLRIEGHDWSATDHGGDGLTVYANGASFSFRLWETKHHTATSAVTTTVGRACRQVRDQSLSYLARFSLVAQQLTDDGALAEFYAGLAERWVDHDPAVGVGISVATSSDADADDCFASLDTYFGLPTDRHHGHLHVIDDFMAFSRSVRIEVWKGCGLWTGP